MAITPLIPLGRSTKGFATKHKPLAEIQIVRRVLISPGERGERREAGSSGGDMVAILVRAFATNYDTFKKIYICYQPFNLARPKRFELLTPRFVVWCSIQLSYGRFARRPGNKPARGSGP